MIASCLDGRIRFRHPALSNPELLTLAAAHAETALATAPAKPARKKLTRGQIKRRTQKIGLAACMAGAVGTGLTDTKAAHLTLGVALAGFAAWHLFMHRRRFLA